MVVKRRTVKEIISTLFLFLVSVVYSLGQAPTHLPQRDPEPTSFTDNTVNVIFYIVIPLIIAIIYFIWRRQNRKNN